MTRSIGTRARSTWDWPFAACMTVKRPAAGQQRTGEREQRSAQGVRGNRSVRGLYRGSLG